MNLPLGPPANNAKGVRGKNLNKISSRNGATTSRIYIVNNSSVELGVSGFNITGSSLRRTFSTKYAPIDDRIQLKMPYRIPAEISLPIGPEPMTVEGNLFFQSCFSGRIHTPVIFQRTNSKVIISISYWQHFPESDCEPRLSIHQTRNGA